MKLNKSIILIICLLLSASIAHATDSERASISVTATVIPMLGIMPTIDHSKSLSVSETSDSKLLIQAPKNSALLIHIENANRTDRVTSSLLISSTQTNSVSDFFTYDISKILPYKESQQIITILTTDN